MSKAAAAIAAIKQSCIDSEYGAIRSILDEVIWLPTEEEQATIQAHLDANVIGAEFQHAGHILGWTYEELLVK